MLETSLILGLLQDGLSQVSRSSEVRATDKRAKSCGFNSLKIPEKMNINLFFFLKLLSITKFEIYYIEVSFSKKKHHTL